MAYFKVRIIIIIIIIITEQLHGGGHFRGLEVKKKSEAYFTFMWPCIVTNFFIIKPTTSRCTNFTNLFCQNKFVKLVHQVGFIIKKSEV